MDYTYFNYCEFDFGSEWTRAKCLDTCKLIKIFFIFIAYWWVMYEIHQLDCFNNKYLLSIPKYLINFKNRKCNKSKKILTAIFILN